MKNFTWSGIIRTALLVLLVLAAFGPTTRRTERPKIVLPPPTPTAKPSQFAVVRHEDAGQLETYAVVVGFPRKAPEAALAVKKQCHKPCNIDVYDDSQAFSLHKQYDDMVTTHALETSQAQIYEWQAQSLSYITQHYVGWIDHRTGKYWNHPFKGVKRGETHSSFYDQPIDF